ncbi:MAG: hypothetical protein EBR82_71085 [Caulobacteraceae bacterium]|nr:hypothetical protein [Caulobacteraceae bacterium]
MILYRMQNGWPTDVIQDPFTGTPPAGTMAFDGTDAMLAYQAANPDKAPKPKPESNVPVEVEAWKLQAVLDRRGKLSAVNAAVDGYKGDDAPLIRARWRRGDAFPRDGATVNSLGAAIGYTPEEVDQLFIEADKITG